MSGSPIPEAAPPGSTSTRRPRLTASSRPAAWSARPGVTGLTLGGGIGHLTAQYGLTCDNLLGATVVTPAEGIVDTEDPGHEELLWGLRGGGGNFGVVTELRMWLHPLERVVGGRLEYEGEGVAEALRAFRDAIAAAGTDLSIQAQLSVSDDLTLELDVVPCYTGEGEEVAELAGLRAVDGLVNDTVRPQGFIDQQLIFNPGYGVDRNYWKGHFVRELPDEAIDKLIERMTRPRSPTGRDPARVAARRVEGRRPRERRPRLSRCSLQRQRDGELARPGR